jgi:hypothetical protein
MGAMLTYFSECTTSAGLETHCTDPTFRSFSSFRPPRGGDPLSPAGDLPSPTGEGTQPAGGGQSPAGSGQSPAGDYHKYSRLDHVYTKGLIYESVVLLDSTTDHRLVVTTVRAGSHVPGAEKLVSLKRQNFKAVTRPELEGALNLTDWTKVYDIKDVDAVLEYITAGIISPLNIVAPEKAIRVKKGPNLYLTRETLETMKKRNAATGKRYRSFSNKVTRLVRRDKQDSNLLSLKKVKNDPKVLWGLADQALTSACECKNQVQLHERDDTLSIPISRPPPPFPSAMELSSAEFCPTRRSWTFCPARARPFWIKRGACLLHDLE